MVITQIRVGRAQVTLSANAALTPMGVNLTRARAAERLRV